MGMRTIVIWKYEENSLTFSDETIAQFIYLSVSRKWITSYFHDQFIGNYILGKRPTEMQLLASEMGAFAYVFYNCKLSRFEI